MKLQELLNLLFEIELKTNSIINMVILDELSGENGIMGLIPEGGAFKVYIESDADGKKDFIMFFTKEQMEEYKDKYSNTKTMLINDLEPNRIKILYVQDLMSLQPINQINDYLQL